MLRVDSFHIILKFLLVGIVALTLSCATVSPTKKAITPRMKQTHQYDPPSIEEEGGQSPATALVTEGIDLLLESNIEGAEWKLEEAINLDPDYGPAFYWLARARYRLDEIDGALDLLDKAESLLKRSQVWVKRISRFREFLQNRR